MSDLETKQSIVNSLAKFASQPISAAATALFESLGYKSDKRLILKPNSPETFIATFGKDKPFNHDQALLADWQTVDFLFQLTDDEVRSAAGGNQQFLFESKAKYNGAAMESYLFFAIALKKPQYTRTELSGITRAVNRLFPMPVMLLLRHGDTLTLAVINRRLHKRDESKDVLEKVTLIKDIRIADPHRAHVEILFDLSFDALRERHDFTNFVALHAAWQKTLDSSELNKRFFLEVANWYFWALKYAEFPKDAPKQDGKDHISVIRLITRLMFCWFVKEKGLVPDTLFDERVLAQSLKGFAPTKVSDKESVFYKAILQNLFFATLNTEMDKRGWTKEEQNFMAHSLYRHRELFQNPSNALDFFKNIPFLNGGLFECLDKDLGENAKPRYVRIDGFSRRDDSQPTVPDFLFFGAEREVDLSDDYGDSKFKKVKVRGLIHTFNHYKFTVTENTPIEEEIALDPELSGKVFENLLAAYNPETGATARKQTGSFYTPREIVNYMVDEALIACLKTKLEEALPSVKDVEVRLRHLFAYNDQKHQFIPAEVDALIAAIDSLKSLDPAVGSGAFPMGILHKLVFILSKIDPENEKWKARQHQRAIRDTEEVVKIGDQEERQRRLEDINEVFEQNASDYGRKLYLIENCIYGVDIQPIAVQIAKMRFFISLVVDQRVDLNASNLGVRPLPNLETKFVAANTLIRINRPGQQLLRNRAIDAKEAELRRVRERHFLARTPKRKAKCREHDADLREEIAELLKGDGWDTATARKLASWNPYDQNSSADFFDPEWMFGITNGFDVTIGNPPYGFSFSDEELKKLIDAYRTLVHRVESYLLFIERSLQLLNERGHLALIVPDTYLNLKFTKALRAVVLEQAEVLGITMLPAKVFEAAVVDTTILRLKRTDSPIQGEFKVQKFRKSDNLISISNNLGVMESLPSSFLGLESFNITADSFGAKIIAKIERSNKRISDIADIFYGIKAYQVGKGKPPQSRAIVDDKPFTSETKRGRDWLPFYDGKDITRYRVLWQENNWIRYGDWLAEPRNPQKFTGEKLLIRKIVGDRLLATYIPETSYCNTLLFVLKLRSISPFNYPVVLGILNSRLIGWFIRSKLQISDEDTFPQIMVGDIQSLPIPDAQIGELKQLAALVQKVLVGKERNAAVDTSALERKIDQQVYALYGLTPEEILIVDRIGSE